jgi:hypothetical protein
MPRMVLGLVFQSSLRNPITLLSTLDSVCQSLARGRLHSSMSVWQVDMTNVTVSCFDLGTTSTKPSHH